MIKTETTKFVPIKPTSEMLIAGRKAGNVGYWEDRVNNIPFQREGLSSNDPAQIYAAMIAAAPAATNKIPYAVRVTVDDTGEIKSHGISYAEMTPLNTQKSCLFCDKKFEGLETLAWHLNVDCSDFDEIVNGLSDE